VLGQLRAPDPPTVEPEPELALAIDARTDTAALRAILRAASEAGARSIRLVGARRPPPPPEQREAIESGLPLLARLTAGRTATRILLRGAVPAGAPATDPALLHATVGADGDAVRVMPRPGADARPFDLSEAHDVGARSGIDDPRPVYLAVGDGASAGSIAEAAARVRAVGHRPLVVPGELPGNPDRALPGLGTFAGDLSALLEGSDDLGLGGIGVGTVGDDDTAGLAGLGSGTADLGSPRVRASLSRDAIRRVIQRHIVDVRRCYRRRLAASPTLSGRITVRFVISPTGNVVSSEATDDTLGDPQVGACVAGAVRGWRFPRPEGGGIVAVTYPFRFDPG